MITMLAASSVVNSNLACSSRISSCSDFTSGHSWRPIEAVKLHRRAVSSIRISCAATKPAKTPGTLIMLSNCFGCMQLLVYSDVAVCFSLQLKKNGKLSGNF